MYCADEAALITFSKCFARALRVGDCVALHGDLGAGKTTFSRAVIRALAGDAQLEVPSPTFTLVQLYDTVPPIAHMDLYRIADPEELNELGLDAALENGAALIEWPGNADGALPQNLINVYLEEQEGAPDARNLKIEAPNDFNARLARSTLIAEFLERNGYGAAQRLAFSGDASTRNYELIETGDETLPLILMDAPRAPDGPPIYDGLPYSQVVHLAEDVSAFYAVSTHLNAHGFCAPKIIAHDMPNGLLLTENLGSGKIVDENNVPIVERYIAAARVLAAIHNQRWETAVVLPDGGTHIVPRYDVRAMRTGLSLLPDWWGSQNGLTDSQVAELYDLWIPIFERFQNGYDDLILRDYHSPNIIWRPDAEGVMRIGIIDHQDALIGPGMYDVASLAQDARTRVNPALQKEIIDAYCFNRTGEFDAAQARLDIATLCAFRNSRLLGLWVRLAKRDNKPRFMDYMPQTKIYLQQALGHPDLSNLRKWYVKAGVIDG